MGGLEKTSFDSKEKILYGISEQGFVSSFIHYSSVSLCVKFLLFAHVDSIRILSFLHIIYTKRSPS